MPTRLHRPRPRLAPPVLAASHPAGASPLGRGPCVHPVALTGVPTRCDNRRLHSWREQARRWCQRPPTRIAGVTSGPARILRRQILVSASNMRYLSVTGEAESLSKPRGTHDGTHAACRRRRCSLEPRHPARVGALPGGTDERRTAALVISGTECANAARARGFPQFTCTTLRYSGSQVPQRGQAGLGRLHRNSSSSQVTLPRPLPWHSRPSCTPLR
jgi:hypothetical protein